MAALAPVHRVTAPLDDVLKDQAALQEWEEFCDRYSQGQFDHTGIPSPPTVIQAILNNTPTRPPLRPLRGDTTNLQNAARPAYADNQYGRPETVSQLLEFYRNHHHFPAPVDANEVRRAAMIRRFGLDRRDLARESCIDEIAKVARAYFKETVLVTVVCQNEILVLGQASMDEDNVDWACAVPDVEQSFSLCRHNVLGTSAEVLVMNDAAPDWRMRCNELYKPCNGPLGSYINAPLILPSFNIDHSDAPTESLPLGGFCLMSPKAREPGSFTQADQDLLANLGQLAAREILRGFGERERARHEAQAAFLSEVIGLDIVDAEELIGAKLKSPGMAAVRDSSVPSATARVGLAAKRSVQRLCSLTSADAAIMLDVHAAFGSSRLYYSVVGALRPITVLASEGFDLPAGGMFHGQQEIREMLAASKAWKPSPTCLAFDGSAFKCLLPESSCSSLAVPIYDHTGTLAVVILMSYSSEGSFIMETTDKVFARNLGQLCLSMLIKSQFAQTEQAKLAFISQVSHELRTPIHGLTGQLALMSEHPASAKDDTFSPLLSVANDCVETLRSTVEEVLFLGALTGDSNQQDQWPPDASDQPDLSELIVELTKASWVRHSRRDGMVNAIVDIAQRDSGWISTGTSAAFRRVAANLIQNACSFTPSGYVRVSLDTVPTSTEPSMVHLRVTDTGVGMSEAFVANGLFEPFRQAESFSPGPGLGMSIVQHIVQTMGGGIQVSSVLGEGTTIEVFFPVSFVNGLTPFPRTVRVLSDELSSESSSPSITSDSTDSTPPWKFQTYNRRGSSESSSHYCSNTETSSPDSSAASSLTGAPRPLRIFAAEDNAISRNILKGLFKNKNVYDLLAVENGQEAVDLFRLGEWIPDVTLMDIQMPIKDGIEAAFEMREHELKMGWPRHRIIALTSLSNAADREKAMENGGPMDAWEIKGGKSLKTIVAELAALQLSL